jgi:hypothetical protein
MTRDDMASRARRLYGESAVVESVRWPHVLIRVAYWPNDRIVASVGGCCFLYWESDPFGLKDGVES